MSKNNVSVYRGAGINGHGFWETIDRAVRGPFKDSFPGGASWPFVKLSIDSKGISFDFLRVHKHGKSSDITVSLNKWGYVRFSSQKIDHGGFMFATLSLDSLLIDLGKRGYILDKTCTSNRLIAKLVILGTTLVFALVAITILTMAILHPNGV